MQTGDSTERSFEALQLLPVPFLSTAEQFIVGVTRCWDAFSSHPDPALPWRALMPVFAYMNVQTAFCAFDTAFRVLRRYRLPTLEFHDVDFVPVGLAEARLLCGLAALQRALPRMAALALTDALSREGIQALLPPLARIAAILDAQGHRLPAWRDTPRRRQTPIPTAGAGAGRSIGNTV